MPRFPRKTAMRKLTFEGGNAGIAMGNREVGHTLSLKQIIAAPFVQRRGAAGGAGDANPVSMPVSRPAIPWTTRAAAAAPLSMKITLLSECSVSYFFVFVFLWFF